MESEWKTFASIDVRSGRLMVGDFSFIPSAEDCVILQVVPGAYVLSAKVMSYPDGYRVSRLRIHRQDAIPAAPAEEVAKTCTDTARTGVCDYELYREARPSSGGRSLGAVHGHR